MKRDFGAYVMTQHLSAITLDHIRAWSSRSKLIESDLREASKETRIRWANLMRLLVTQRAEKHGVRDTTKELVPDLILSEQEKERVLRWLSDRFARRWRRHQPAVRRALSRLNREDGTPPHALKRQALRPAIIEALHDADEEQVTRVGRDRVWTQGSRLILLQKKDLEEAGRKGTADELIRKLTAQPAGLRGSPSWSAHEPLSPIEAAFQLAELEAEAVRPLELRPTLLLRWVRRRAFEHAKEGLLNEAELDRTDAPASFRKVRTWAPRNELDEAPSACEVVSELELLEALGRDDPDPMESLIALEKREELSKIGTSRQLEYLAALTKRWAQGMTEAEAIKEVAKEREVRPNTVHKNLQRLRDRAAEHHSEN